jgi:hypothetical protein
MAIIFFYRKNVQSYPLLWVLTVSHMIGVHVTAIWLWPWTNGCLIWGVNLSGLRGAKRISKSLILVVLEAIPHED